MSSPLFRKQALERHLASDARGAVLAIAPPRTAAILGAMTAVLVALGLLLGFGEASEYASGRGIVVPSRPPIVVRAPIEGVVDQVVLSPGGQAKRSDLLLSFDVTSRETEHATCTARQATLQTQLDALLGRLSEPATADRDPGAALVLRSEQRDLREQLAEARQTCAKLEREIGRSRVYLPVDATVSSLSVGVGSLASVNEPIATLAPSDARLLALISVPEAHRNDLVPGATVRLRFDSIPNDSIGVGSGTVTRLLDGPPAGTKLEAEDGSAAFAEVSIDTMPKGARARAGMKLAADVFVKRRRLMAIVFGGP